MSLMSDLGSAIKSKLNLKADKNNPTFTGTVILPLSTSIGNVDSTKISYLSGVTSDLQSQINVKQNILVSGLDVKTINGVSILGNGNLDLTSINISGNSGSTTKLQTYRKINNTAFDGTSDIVTAIWGTTRNITVGNNTKVINGSADVSFSHSEIGTVKDLGLVTINPVSGSNLSCTTAQFVTFLSALGAFNQPLSILRVTWSYSTNNNISDIPFGQLELAGCIIEIFYSSATQYMIRVTSPSTGVGAGGIHEYINYGETNSPGWRRVYTSQLNGNCDTATKLVNSRTINGVVFDGTSNITITDNTKASLESPNFTGTPTAPTPIVGDNSTKIATTAFVLSNSDVVSAATVSSAISGIATGAIGSYAILARTTPGLEISAGSNYAGSGLAYCGFGSSNMNSNAYSMTLGASPSGTWKAMGDASAFDNIYSATLFLRIA